MIKEENMHKQLAILGGGKTITLEGPHYVWPVITKKIEGAVLEQLHRSISIYDRSGIFEKFEDEFAKYHNKKYALLCSSGTLAIHSMYFAAGLKKGDEVICPAYTFFATVTPLLFTGAKPILCDCDETGNIDPTEIRKKISKKTKAIVVTHMWGIPCKMDEIMKICKEYGLLLLEDASHAHGATYQGKVCGSFGDMAAWSLQGPKTVTGGEGGIMVTNNKEFYYRALMLGHYNKRCRQEIPKKHPLRKYAVTGMGLKYRAHPIAIAMADEMFKHLAETLSGRNYFANKIFESFKGNKIFSTPKMYQGSRPSWYAYVFQANSQLNDSLLERLYEAFKAEGLAEIDRPSSTSPLNLLPLFQDPKELFPVYKNNYFSYQPGDFPNAEDFYKRAFKIPVWSNKKDNKIVRLYIEGIEKVSANYKKLI